MLKFCLNEWLTDIKVNQLPNILGGFGPMHSIVQLGKDSSLLHCNNTTSDSLDRKRPEFDHSICFRMFVNKNFFEDSSSSLKRSEVISYW